jgi:hypothetical protein
MEQMDRLLRELHDLRGRGSDAWRQEHLRWEDWGRHQKEAAVYAAQELRRRGRRSGAVLPGGYDAESIAGQAVADVLEGKSRLTVGWTRGRLMQELRRRIRGKIRLLGMLKEGAKADGGPDPKFVGKVEEVGGPEEDGFEVLARLEDEGLLQRMKGQVEGFLSGESTLARVFGCWCEGIDKPAEIGRRLGMDAGMVASACKRLRRRLARFKTGASPGKMVL